MVLKFFKNLIDIKHNYKQCILFGLFILFLASSFLYIKTYKIVFALLNAAILGSHLILFKGKYRIYGLFLYMPFVVFFNYKPLGLGSFYSYIILFYDLIVIIETIFKKEKLSELQKRRLILGIILAFYSLLLSLLFSDLKGTIKTVSIFGYLLSISLLAIDNKAYKKIGHLIALLIVSFFLSNALAYGVLYVLKGDIALSFLRNFLPEVYYLKYISTNNSFRFPGLSSDPNYLGMYTLVLTALYALNFKKVPFKYLLIVFVLGLHFFSLYGSSRNYILATSIALLVLGVFCLIKFKYGWMISTFICLGGLIIFFIFGNSLIAPVLLRSINVDARAGFFASLTSDRSTLQTYYFSYYLSHPIVFIFGRGFTNSLLSGNSAHSVYVMSFLYFGVFGTILYYWYIFSFFNLKLIKKQFLLAIPLIILIIYGLTLDYISYAEFLLFLIYIYNLTFIEKNNIIKTNKESTQIYEITI